MGIVRLIKKRWYLFLVLLLLGAFIFYQKYKSSAVKRQSYKVTRQDLKDTLSLSGSIDSDQDVSLSFQSSGLLSWVGVKEGDYVEKYQALASLDQRSLQDNLKKFLNTYVQQRYAYDTSTETNDIKNTGGLSEDARRQALRALADAQYNLDNSVLDVELQQIAIQYASLVSPIEGIVVAVGYPYAGVNVLPTTTAFEVINPKTVFFSATADQTDVVNIKQGMEGDIVLDSYPDSNIKAKITDISFVPKAGETGTVYEVKMPINVSNTDYKYRFGMTGDVDFVTRVKKNVLVVPTSYLKNENGKTYVFKNMNGKIVKSYVGIGEEVDTSTEITSGLNEGDIIYDQA